VNHTSRPPGTKYPFATKAVMGTIFTMSPLISPP
jgi:hypothetical protein